MAHRSKFLGDNFTNICFHFLVDIFWGVLWGVGGLMYGLGMRYLGMSLGNSVLLGFTSAFGALAPSIYYNFHPQEGKTTPKEQRLSKAAALAPVLREFCSTLRGIMLGSHGLFTWGDTSCESYLHTLQVVETCAQYLEENYGK